MPLIYPSRTPVPTNTLENSHTYKPYRNIAKNNLLGTYRTIEGTTQKKSRMIWFRSSIYNTSIDATGAPWHKIDRKKQVDVQTTIAGSFFCFFILI